MMTSQGIIIICIGLLSGAQMVDGAISAAAISAAAGAISAGTSLVGTTMQGLMGDGYKITTGITVENWTKWSLMYPTTRIGTGALTKPPRAVLPGKREAMVARKQAHTATGSWGTVSWLIQGIDRRMYIMWSVPFNYDFFSNWMSLGLSRSGYTSHPEGNTLFDLMYYGASNSDISFRREKYYYNSNPLVYRDDQVEVVGTMGTSHKAEIRIIVRPNRDEDLAPGIKILMQKRKMSLPGVL